MSRQEETVLAFKPSEKQWAYLEPMGKRTRSGYVRKAVEAYVTAHPVITAIPIHEPPDEAIRYLPVRFNATPAVIVWLDQLPTLMRSYMVRCSLNWYWEKREAAEDPQQVLDLNSALKATGTET